MAVIPEEYDRAVQSEYPGGTTGHSNAPVDRFWMGLRASFPDATPTIDHQIGRNDPLMPPRAAVRWALHGKHDGWGYFGAPTGADVYVLGISHAESGPRGGVANSHCMTKLRSVNRSFYRQYESRDLVWEPSSP